MVVEPASKEHQTSHDQAADRSAEQLILGGNPRSPPQMEQARSNLNTLETAADIAIEDVLTNDVPHYLSAGLDANGVREPGYIIRKFCPVEIHATEPDKNNAQMPKVSRKKSCGQCLLQN